jgi:redox-sensing transcriptional repressor
MGQIPLPVIYRLSYLFDILEKMEEDGIHNVSSAELGEFLGQSSHTIRKDIHYLGAAGTAGNKYVIDDIKRLISDQLGYRTAKRCCVVGLGRLGSALLEHPFGGGCNRFRVVAGFDTNVNRLETIRSSVELYPAYRIPEIVRRLEIDLALIAVPHDQAQEAADRCCEGGVRGLLNFTPMVLVPKNSGVCVRSIDITGELRILTALSYTRKADESEPYTKE